MKINGDGIRKIAADAAKKNEPTQKILTFVEPAVNKHLGRIPLLFDADDGVAVGVSL